MYEILGYADAYINNYLVDNNYVSPQSYSNDYSNIDTSSNDEQDYQVDISPEAYKLAQSE